MGFFGFYRILPSFYWVLLGFYPIFTRFHLVLQGFTGFFLVLLGFTGFANLPWQRSTVAVGPQPIDSPLIDRFGLRCLFFFYLQLTIHSVGLAFLLLPPRAVVGWWCRWKRVGGLDGRYTVDWTWLRVQVP